MGTRDWDLMHYSNPSVTGGQKHTHTLHFTNHANLALLAPTKHGGGGGNNSRSILERMRKAEMLVGKDDEPTIERLVARAKVVRADLKAAARARSKLLSSYAPAPPPGGVGEQWGDIRNHSNCSRGRMPGWCLNCMP
jgi:hypothetical protein